MGEWDEKVLGVQNATSASVSESQQLQKAIQSLLTGAAQVAGGQQGGQQQGPLVAPGNVPPIPGSNISFNPGGAPGGPLQHAPARQPNNVPPTGSQSIGHFANRGEATNAGLVSLGNSLSGLFSSIENKEHAKKANMAENYMTQISALLASGDPKDKEKAMMFLEDPKIRKILKTGLEYVPLEEEVPPEAQGVQAAAQKIAARQGGGAYKGGDAGQVTPGSNLGQRQMRPVLPQASQQQQLQSAITSALLQKIQQDPASAITMMGGSNLTSAEQRSAEFYEKGLGLSPVQIASLSSAEKLAGIKMYEGVARDALKAEVDIYKADKTYSGRVDSARIFAATRDRMTDAIKAAKDKKGAAINYAAGAKVYAGLAADYLRIVQSGKGADGKPLTDEQKKYYEQQAQTWQQKADDYLQQTGDEELFDLFEKSIGEPPEE